MLLGFICHGQGMEQVIPLGTLPMEFNSSFAGQAGSPRLNTLIHYGGSRMMGRRNDFAYAVSYDQFIPTISSGIAFTVMNHSEHYDWTNAFFAPNPNMNNEIPGKVNYRSASIAIAPKIAIKGKYTLSPSMDLTYNQVNTSNMPFIDDSERNFLRSKASLLFNSNKFYAGYAVYMLNRKILMQDGDGRRQSSFLSFLQMGYTVKTNEESKFSFTPQIAIRISDQYYLSRRNPFYQDAVRAFNLNFMYKQISWGFNNTGVHGGWQNNNLKVLVSALIKQERLSDTMYSANISLRYVFAHTTKSLF
jgi:hypothetical protein